MLTEVADRVAHVLGPGRAVEADHVDPERLEGGQDGRDVRSEEHLAAVGQKRDRGLDRNRPPGFSERLAGAEYRGLDLEDVLSGLDDQQVDAAGEQARRLLCEERPPARGS